jgi:hypothetical protein
MAMAEQSQLHMDSGGGVLVCTLTLSGRLSSSAAPCRQAIGPSGSCRQAVQSCCCVLGWLVGEEKGRKVGREKVRGKVDEGGD